MKFAKVVFLIAAIWGVLAVFPLYFAIDFLGRTSPPAINHPEFYYGFVGVTLAWQFVFFLIRTDPHRYRLLMLPSILEKASYVLALLVLFLRQRIPLAAALPATSDLVLGILFLVAYLKTNPSHASPQS